MTASMPKRDQKRLAELRRQWRMWRRAQLDELSHIDYCLAECADECGTCDGCVSAAFRAERVAQIEDEAAEITALHLLRTELGAVVLDPTGTEGER